MNESRVRNARRAVAVSENGMNWNSSIFSSVSDDGGIRTGNWGNSISTNAEKREKSRF